MVMTMMLQGLHYRFNTVIPERIPPIWFSNIKTVPKLFHHLMIKPQITILKTKETFEILREKAEQNSHERNLQSNPNCHNKALLLAAARAKALTETAIAAGFVAATAVNSQNTHCFKFLSAKTIPTAPTSPHTTHSIQATKNRKTTHNYRERSNYIVLYTQII